MNKDTIRYRSKDTLHWNHAGVWYKVQILPQVCQRCKLPRLTGMPEPLRLGQPDKTNVVCNPGLGGCNQGYEMDIDPACLSCEWDGKT